MAAEPEPNISTGIISAQLKARLSPFFPEDEPGIAIAIARHGAVAETLFMGLANFEFGVPWRSDTLYSIYSVTKPMVALIVFEAHDEGLLSIDDPISQHLDGFSHFDDEILIRHLLTHTSGLYNDELLLDLVGAPLNAQGYSVEESANLIRRQERLSWRPGTYFCYSDTAMRLLASVLERVSGESFAHLMQKRIFEPAGMETAVVAAHETGRIANRASTYFRKRADSYNTRDWWMVPSSTGQTSGDGGAVGSVLDLARFVLYLQGEDGAGQPRFRRLAERVPLGHGLRGSYRWSLESRRHAGHEFLYHRGIFGKAAGFFPDLGIGVAIMHNNMSAYDDSEILPFILDGVLEAAEIMPIMREPAQPLPDDILPLLTGLYLEPDSSVFVRFEHSGSGVSGHLLGRRIEIVRGKDGTAMTNPASADATAQWVARNGELFMRQADWPDYRRLWRAQEPGPAGTGGEGIYYSDAFGASYTVQQIKNRIKITIGPRVSTSTTINLTSVAKNFFVSAFPIYSAGHNALISMAARFETEREKNDVLTLTLDGIRNFQLRKIAELPDQATH